MYYHEFLSRVTRIHYKGEHKPVDKEEMDIILGAVPFVFFPEGEIVNTTNSPIEDFDLPFKAVWFEMTEDKVITEVIENGVKIIIGGILAVEVKPREYLFYALMQANGYSSVIYCNPSMKELYTHFKGIVQHLNNRIGREETGETNPRQFIKVKSGTEKYKHRISKVIYVAPKKSIEKISALSHKTIDWSHRWAVRGHWRKIEGKFGKDRESNPIFGFTWISDHVKGPENLALVKKLRVVKPSNHS